MKRKWKIALFSTVGVLSLSLSMFTFFYFSLLHHYKGKEVVNEWHKTDVFDINKVKTLEKKKDEPFVIMNLADVQICDLDDTWTSYKLHRYLDKLVETYKPNLITLSGEQTWSNENLISLKSIIRWLNGYKIPFAPVFGNHDYGNGFNTATASREYCCDLYEEAKYSLFDRGPTNIGSLGNYAINIVEEGQIIQTLYMLDLGVNWKITDEQAAWFKWTADGIKAANNNLYPQGIVITHKELPEFRDAYEHYRMDPSIAEGLVTVHMGFDKVENTGFVDLAKSCGVYDFMSGHEHYNNFTLNHDGARFTFMVKTGEFFDYYEDETVRLVGTTTMSISKDKPIIEHHYL